MAAHKPIRRMTFTNLLKQLPYDVAVAVQPCAVVGEEQQQLKQWK